MRYGLASLHEYADNYTYPEPAPAPTPRKPGAAAAVAVTAPATAPVKSAASVANGKAVVNGKVGNGHVQDGKKVQLVQATPQQRLSSS